MIHELGEDCLSGIHPSLLTIEDAIGHPTLAPCTSAVNFKSKNVSYNLSLVICRGYSDRPDFSRTLLRRQIQFWSSFALTGRCRVHCGLPFENFACFHTFNALTSEPSGSGSSGVLTL